ncbi:hypothetical protein D3C86_2194790 [compost metagenome]
MVQQAGNALGVALVGILFYGQLGGEGDYTAAFGVALVYLMVSALLVAVLRGRGSRMA